LSAAPAVVFDLDDTLVADAASIAAALRNTAALAAEMQEGVEPAALADSVRRRARELWHAHPLYPWAKRIGIASNEALWSRFGGDGDELAQLRAWAPEYRRRVWELALEDHGIFHPSMADSLAARFGTERRARFETFPDAVPVLEALHGTRPLGLLTNGEASLQREKLAASGLEPYFDATVVSSEIDAGKPEPAAFAAMLERLDASSAVMVGDSLERDIDGALGAGLRAVWVNRNGTDGGRPGVPVVRSLAELPALLS
jgi:putative hydrolase of the HAD superfamily